MELTLKNLALYVVFALAFCLAVFNLYSLYFYTLGSVNMWFHENHPHPELYVVLLLGQTAGCWAFIGFVIGRLLKPKCSCK